MEISKLEQHKNIWSKKNVFALKSSLSNLLEFLM